jgi:hypothetical protein
VNGKEGCEFCNSPAGNLIIINSDVFIIGEKEDRTNLDKPVQADRCRNVPTRLEHNVIFREVERRPMPPRHWAISEYCAMGSR